MRFGRGFRVIPGSRVSQAAEMVLSPGDAEGDAGNRHRGADTLNFYAPPAYRKDGEPLSRGKR